MSTRARLPRKAAIAATYVYDNPSDEEDEQNGAETDEDEMSQKRVRGKGKPAPKRRKTLIEESEMEDESEDEDGEVEMQKAKQKVIEHDVPRVDFSKVLPYEIVVEILSYLHPYSLYGLSLLNKPLRSILMSESSQKLWRKTLGVEELPVLGEEELHPAKLCALMLDKKCQFCDVDNAMLGDPHLLLRLCKDCRMHNWVSVADVGPGKKYPDFHPATLLYSPESASYPCRQRNYVYYGDVQATSETLETLELEDEAGAEKPWSGIGGPDARQVSKSLSRARKLKRRQSWYSSNTARAEELETRLVEGFSGQVKEYVVGRMDKKRERKALADWLRLHGLTLRNSRDNDEAVAKQAELEAVNLRRAALEDRILSEGVFTNRNYFYTWDWRCSALVQLVRPVTDDDWDNLKVPTYRLLGSIEASAIYTRFSRKGGNNSDDDSDRPRLPKRPKAVSAAAWKYILPEVRKLAKARRLQEEHLTNEPVEATPPPTPKKTSFDSKQRPSFEWAKVQAKNAFFRPRYDKLVKGESGGAITSVIPSFRSYLHLDAVQSLYDQPDFGVNDNASEEDTAVYVDCLDGILEEIESRRQDLRFDALKLILRATTEMTDKELDNLDPDVLANEYNDDFFRRPTSWICCSRCGQIASAHATLVHAKKYGCYASLPAGTSPFSMPLEVACAWSAILELAPDLDPEDSAIAARDLDAAFEKKWLVWDNAPKYKGGKKEWRELICKAHKVAGEFDRRGEYLAAPVIAMKKKGKSRRRWGRWWC